MSLANRKGKLPNFRNLIRFRLRALLLTMLVFFTAFGGRVAYRRHQAQVNQQRVAAVERALAAVDRLGGVAEVTRKEMRAPTWLEELFKDPGGAEDPIENVDVRDVYLNARNAIDED